MTKPRYNQNVTVTVKNLGSHGEGVGFWHGYTLFIPGALPGECVRGRISQAFKRHGEVRLDLLSSLSGERVDAPCPIASSCGGCQLMHLAKEGQLRFKREKVVKELQRFGFKEELVLPCRAGKAQGYRNKMQLKVFDNEGALAFGMIGRFGGKPVSIDQCLVHSSFGSSVFRKVIASLRSRGVRAYSNESGEGLKFITLRSSERTGQALLILTAGETSPFYQLVAEEIAENVPEIKGIVLTVNSVDSHSAQGEKSYLLTGVEEIEEVFLGLSFIYSHSSFLQVNTEVAEEIYRQAIAYLEGESIHRVADLYSGIGALSILLAHRFKEVVGIEFQGSSVFDARKNAERLNRGNVTFLEGKTEELLPQAGPFDAAIVNPPRMGCEESVLETLADTSVQKIVYISCEPKTLARDGSFLSKRGYTLQEAAPFDLFPETAHVETIALFSRQ